MNRLASTLAQDKAIASVNMMRDADKFVRRLYGARKPLGTANDALHAHLLTTGLVRLKDGRLLELTRAGEDYAEDLGR
ncbi:hypothetical protein LZK73_18680 [Neorhizobium galegae]|nr:hypothetical protein LZK73_18680 [Neorhizobium galegae]